MSYYHLSIDEHSCIYQFKNLGMGIREIALGLKRSPSTISRELKRNGYKSNHMYKPTTAQNKYMSRREKCHRYIQLDDEVKNYIE